MKKELTLSSCLFSVAWLLLAMGLAACAAGPDVPPRPETSTLPTGATHTIFVTSNGWHSSIVLARSDLPPGSIPEAADFPEARFLEFGWGDAEYYPAEHQTIGMTLRAVLLPTPAVVHVAGLTTTPVVLYPDAEVVSLSIRGRRLEHLVKFIDASFDRGERERVAASGPGLYTYSKFYPALGKFHLFNTCNTWSARALAFAGFGVSISGTQTAEELMRQVRELGKQGRSGTVNLVLNPYQEKYHAR